MIPLGNMSGMMALKLVDNLRDRELAQVEREPIHARAIKAVRERMKDVESVDDLMADRELYVFTMKAFDLEDQIFGKKMIEKILKSDITDKTSLVNRLTDPRFKTLYNTLGFKLEGKTNFNTLSETWRENLIDRYVERQFINKTWDENPVVANVLEFREKVGGLKTWFDVLKDKQMSIFMRTALGIPESAVKLDIDRQARMFEQKLPLAKLKDPAEVTKVERKFMILAEIQGGTAVNNNQALNMLWSGGGFSGNYTPVTIDMGLIASMPRKPYF